MKVQMSISTSLTIDFKTFPLSNFWIFSSLIKNNLCQAAPGCCLGYCDHKLFEQTNRCPQKSPISKSGRKALMYFSSVIWPCPQCTFPGNLFSSVLCHTLHNKQNRFVVVINNSPIRSVCTIMDSSHGKSLFQQSYHSMLCLTLLIHAALKGISNCMKLSFTKCEKIEIRLRNPYFTLLQG